MSIRAEAMKPKPIVGQTLYDLNVGNRARIHSSSGGAQKLTPVIVRSIGRKYFTCSSEGAPHMETQYHLDTWREKSEFSVGHELYETEKEWLDINEAETLYRHLKEVTDFYANRGRYSLTQLRAVMAILAPAQP